ncbi:MAG: hypothetical protein AAF108_05255 [Planctomycetota bacterium]
MLLAVNAGLLFGAVAVPASRAAWAVQAGLEQPGRAGPRAGGRYTLVTGDYLGGVGEAMYILDVENRELAAVLYDPALKTVRIAGYRDLARDAQERPGR